MAGRTESNFPLSLVHQDTSHVPQRCHDLCVLVSRSRQSKAVTSVFAIFIVVGALVAGLTGCPERQTDGKAESKTAPALEDLVAALQAEDYGVRSAAAEVLGDRKDPRAVQPLIAALADRDSTVFNFEGHKLYSFDAADALAKIGQPAVGPLITALKHEHPVVRLGACAVLGDIGDRQAVKPLLAVLNNSSEAPDVRATAGVALGELGDARAAEPLAAIANDKHESSEVRFGAAHGLGRLGDARAVGPLLEHEDDMTDEGSVNSLVGIGKPAVEPLIAALRDESPRVRGVAAESLGGIGDPQAVEPLIAVLDDKDEDVRRRSVWALGTIGDQRAVEPLIALLDDEKSLVAGHAAIALGAMDDPRVVDVLIDALSHQHAFARRCAAKALGEKGDPRATDALIATLDDEHQNVRQEAAVSLRKITEEDFGTDAEQWEKWWEQNKAGLGKG